ncbi:MAG: iron transporter [Geminicoccaceae bacterium]
MQDASERPSGEADRRQLELAAEEGDAYQRALTYMVEKVADTGGRKEAGQYIVGFAQERAEGMYHLRGEDDLQWVEPGDENCHLEIAVCDAGDRRFIPGLEIEAMLTAADGTRIGPFEVPFLWHPGLYHYGRNVEVPGDGHYTLTVKIAPPRFMRHDRANGRRYARTVEVTFENVRITTGKE